MLKPGDSVIWKRQERGGKRRFVKIPVEVVSVTPAGNYVIRYERHSRLVTVVVKPTSLEEGS